MRRYSVNSERYAGWFVFGFHARRAFQSLPLAAGETAIFARWRRNGVLEILGERYRDGSSEQVGE